jgi:hypothetical protein
MNNVVEQISKATTPTDTYCQSEIRLKGFQYSGTNLIDEVNSLNPQSVVDVGCGVNYFSGKIKNLIGFDVVNYPGIDFHCSIQDMVIAIGSVDVVLALGPLQYSNRALTVKDIQKIVKWIRPGGYLVVRNKPFVSESESESSGFTYRWSQQWFEKIGSDFGLHVVKGPLIDTNTNVPGLERIVWWWQKS